MMFSWYVKGEKEGANTLPIDAPCYVSLINTPDSAGSRHRC